MIRLKAGQLGRQYRKDDTASGIFLPKRMRLPDLGDDPNQAKQAALIICLACSAKKPRKPKIPTFSRVVPSHFFAHRISIASPKLKKRYRRATASRYARIVFS